MTPDRQERVRSWVNHLVNLSPEERLGHLEQIGGDDPAMRREIEVRLGSSDLQRSLAGAPSSLSEQRRDRVGQTIYHYRIDEKLGGGGMGIVYKAQDLRLDRAVALKFLPPTMDDDDERLKRLIVEARAASALDHPNICTIHQIEQTHDGHWFIVMAYYDGDTLKKHIEKSPLPVTEVLEIAIQVAQGLCKAHKSGIVHRDLKPANLMITTEQVVKIVDFGLAQLNAQTKLTAPGTRLGTPAYMSPEQAQGQPLDHRTDIWSMGVVLYEMLASRPPFKGEYELAVIYSIVNEDPPPVTQFREDSPEALVHLIQKCLAKDPADRLQQMQDLLDELKDLRYELRSGSEIRRADTRESRRKSSKTIIAPVPPPPSAKTRSRGRAIAVGAAAVVALVAAGLLLQSPPPTTQPPTTETTAPAVETPEPTSPPVTATPPPPAGSEAANATTETSETAAIPEPPPAPKVEKKTERPATPKTPPVSAAPKPERPPVTPPPRPTQLAPESPAPATPPVTEPPAEPKAEPVNQAAQELAEWTRVRDSRDIAEVEAFLRQHPEGSLRREALSRIEELQWDAARTATNPTVIENYLRDNPTSRYVSQARARLEELRPPPPVPAPVVKAAPEPPKQEVPKPEVKAEPPRPTVADEIREVLKKFGAAYRSRDVRQVAAVWPSLTQDQQRRLANSFRVAVSVQQDLIPLSEPAIKGDDATIRCRRSSRYEDERGPQRPVDEDVTVTLHKRQGNWLIESVK